MVENLIKNRAEIAFFYDIRDCNPNGDPLAENRPRIDEETSVCYVTDVRLKRTIRDYLRDYENQTILIDEFEKDDGTIKMARERADDFLKKNTKADPQVLILENCIDARLFGCAIPLGTGQKSIQVTGPVQFNYGRSVHEVEDILLQGTAAFASKAKAQQRSFRQDYILHYALIKFYGIVNEHLAKISSATNEDFNLLLKAIWNGTESLQSRSKVGHFPRLLLIVIYNESDFLIGQIDKSIKVLKIDINKPDKALRGIEEFEFDLSLLLQKLKDFSSKIHEVRFKIQDDVKFKGNLNLENELAKLNIKYTKL